MPSMTSLMSGGWEEDWEMDFASEEDLAREKALAEAEAMSLPVLLSAFEDAMSKGDDVLASVYEEELASRDELDNDHQDRRKEWLENYAADEMDYRPIEEDELPY